MKQISFPTLPLLKNREKNSSFVQTFGSFETWRPFMTQKFALIVIAFLTHFPEVAQ